MIIVNANVNFVLKILIFWNNTEFKKNTDFLKKNYLLGCYEYLPRTSKMGAKLLYTPIINAHLQLVIIISKIFKLMFVSLWGLESSEILSNWHKVTFKGSVFHNQNQPWNLQIC